MSEKKCHSCLKSIESGIYCPRCRSALFGVRIVRPLRFDKTEFYTKRRELQDRMSISGMQDKISLKFDETGNLVPTAEDGRFILKPVPTAENLANNADVVANEHLSMQISKQIFGIPTAESALIPFSDGELAYITKRFDYATDGTKLDQEDFASVLGKTEYNEGREYKYSMSYQAIAEAITRYIPASRPALENFYRRVLLNYLIGNDDAHLKNFSIYRPEGRRDYDLTPNYDILYARYHINGYLGLTALDMFAGSFETTSCTAAGFYTLEDFELFGLEVCKIPQKRLVKIIEEVFRSQSRVVDMIGMSFMSEAGRSAYTKNYFENLKKRFAYMIDGDKFVSTSILAPLVDRFVKKEG